MKVLNFPCGLVNRESKEVKDVSTIQKSLNSNEKFKGGYPFAKTEEIDSVQINLLLTKGRCLRFMIIGVVEEMWRHWQLWLNLTSLASFTYEKRVMVWNFGIMTSRTLWYRIMRIVVVEKVREPIGGVILDLSIGNLVARATL